jgi:predicted DNA-binding protein (UPF0251 family)
MVHLGGTRIMKRSLAIKYAYLKVMRLYWKGVPMKSIALTMGYSRQSINNIVKNYKKENA